MADAKVKCIPVGQLGTNCYLVWEEDAESCVLIDPGDEADRIRGAAGGRHIDAILLTHGHFDHIGAVRALMEDDTALVIHKNDAPMLSDTALNVSWMTGEQVTAPAPTHLTHEGDTLHYAGLTFTVMHTPGHTPGCVCYVLGNVIFTGDLVMGPGWPGRTDLPGGNDEDMEASLARVMPLRGQYRLLGGHG